MRSVTQKFPHMREFSIIPDSLFAASLIISLINRRFELISIIISLLNGRGQPRQTATRPFIVMLATWSISDRTFEEKQKNMTFFYFVLDFIEKHMYISIK